MNLSPNQLSEFRHQIRSDLNQVLGYAELLANDQTGELPEGGKIPLDTLQTNTKRILHITQLLFNGEIVNETLLRAKAKEAMADLLNEMGECTARLLNVLPKVFLPDLQRIQEAYLGLRSALEQPIGVLVTMQRIGGSGADRPASYVASVPLELPNGAKLLVVDDSEANIQLLERQLADLGISVQSASNGADTITALAAHSFDCVLLDMVLPGMDGPTILRTIRANPEWSGIPVLMLSAMDEIDQAAACIEFGAEDYIARPVDRSMLRAKVFSTIQRKRLFEDCQILSKDLEDRNEELRQFAMVVSHDLQVPLRSLTGKLVAIQTALDRKGLDEVSSMLADCASRCNRMGKLVKDLLVYARLGQVEPSIERVELDWVLSEVTANLHLDIETSQAKIVHSKLPAVDVDYRQMTLVFQNLISNSIQYRSAAPLVIEIEAQERISDVVIYFRDNGVGIPDSQHLEVFEPFKRLHGDEIPGTGLGLAIVKRALERCQGRIWIVRDDQPGATFAFSLPKGRDL